MSEEVKEEKRTKLTFEELYSLDLFILLNCF